MKKNLFYLFALICSMSLFTACDDDDDEVSPWIGTYKIAEYTAEDYEWTENETTKNWPMTGALYTDWQFTGEDNYPEFISLYFDIWVVLFCLKSFEFNHFRQKWKHNC